MRAWRPTARRCRRSRQRQRLQEAYEAALPWLEKELEHRAVIGVGDVRAAALRGLIAHGIEKTADIDAVTERFMAEGVRQHGQETKLYWQEARSRGRPS